MGWTVAWKPTSFDSQRGEALIAKRVQPPVPGRWAGPVVVFGSPHVLGDHGRVVDDSQSGFVKAGREGHHGPDRG
ncbi:MAG TPA: hypothetical protein VFI46_02405 [Jiangellaceae bacterium]|nr:hypothetical protein [Jiangellaceae bacterium]